MRSLPISRLMSGKVNISGGNHFLTGKEIARVYSSGFHTKVILVTARPSVLSCQLKQFPRKKEKKRDYEMFL